MKISLKIRAIALMLCVLAVGMAQAQTVKRLGSVASSRGSNWTLDGGAMTNTVAKLSNPANFGGTVSYSICLGHEAGTITASVLSQYHVFFIGYWADATFSTAELQAMSTWVNAGGYLFITADASAYDRVAEYFGYPVTGSSVAPYVPASGQANHPAFVGPFGSLTSYGNSGSFSYFGNTAGATVIAQDNSARAVLLEKSIGSGKILIGGDVDAFGNATLSTGSGISNAHDRLMANTFHYLLSNSASSASSTAAEINLQGNGVSISDGDITPSVADHTDFGSTPTGTPVVRTFTLQNTASGTTLDIPAGGITLSGANAALFTVGGISLPATVSGPSGSATFTVTYTPTAIGTHTATVNIVNNDCNEAPYNFDLKGQATCATPDSDGDGYTVCTGDCAEGNNAVNPGVSEVLGNGIDDNCDGLVDIIPYCTPTVTYPCQYMWITKVVLQTVNNTSTCGTGGYSNFTAQSTNLTAGTSYTISISGGATSSYNQNSRVFIDWNRDGDFNDAGETVVNSLLTYYNAANSTTFAVPSGASGSYRMRVISDYTSNPLPTSCATTYGEAEDYTVVVGSPCTAPTFTACPSAPVTASTASGLCNAAVTYNVAANGTPAPTLSYAFTGATTGSGTGGTGSGTIFNKGTTTVTVTATNTCGAPTCMFNVVVSDNIPPTLSGCPGNILLKTNDDSGADCAVTGTYTAPTFSDNCDGTGTATYVSGPASGTSLSVSGSPYTVVYTKTDAAGNAVQTNCTFTVTVQDDTKPTLSGCPSNIALKTSDDGGADCEVTLTYTAPTFSDNCDGSGIATLQSGPASGASLNVSSSPYAVVYTKTDVAGNAVLTDCTFTVTVQDDTKPTLSGCPSNIALKTSDDGGADCAVTVTYTAPTFSDNCDGSGTATLSSGPASGTSLNVSGSPYTVVYTKTDAAGNAVLTNCSFTVEVQDDTKPTLSGCPSNILLKTSDDGGADCEVTVTYTPPTFSDNCDGTGAATYVSGPASGTSLNVSGSPYTVVYSKTDAAGNTVLTNCTFTVTVQDDTQPGITCPGPQTVPTDPNGCSTPPLTYTVTTTDNCSATATLLSGLPSGSLFPLGVNTVVWKTTDTGGNSTTCAFTVTVGDIHAPSIMCPQNIARNTDTNQCTAFVTFTAPTVSDNCTGWTLARTGGLPSGSAFPTGATLVSWTVTDVGGNQALCQFSVTVTDAQAPAIMCPQNIARNTDANLCSAVVNYTTPTATDNCAVASVTLHSAAGTASGSAFPKGTTVVEWKATDTASPTANTATCSFTVTVNDAQLPTITCPSNIVKGTDAGQCYAATTYSTPTASDNCTGVSAALHSGLPSGSNFPKGANTVVWKATDAAGLTRTCSFRVTVNDTENPVISCPTVAPVTTTANSCASAPVNYPTPTATDNCTTVTVLRLSGPASGSTFPLGSTNVTWRAIDGAGRSSTCSFAVTVMDATLPGITCPGSQSVTGSGNPCVATVTYTTPTGTDNCGVQSVTLLSGLASGSIFPAGATMNVWRAIDNAGLSATCSFTITVSCGASSDPSKGWGNAADERDGATSNFKISNFKLNLVPNPATSEVQIFAEKELGADGELRVLDAQGRLVWRQPVSAGHQQWQFDLDDRWQSGLYFVTLRSEDGQTATKRLVVSRL